MEIKNIKIEEIEFGSSIQSVVVPEALKTRIPAGLDYFDCILGGEGFTPSAVSLFTGVPGAGKTTMMLALANALQRLGSEVVFNTAEESLYQIKMTCDRLKLKQPFKVIGQVTKEGKMAGSNKLKHMVDAHIHLSIETKDEDLKGCRILETQKNRFGGAGHVVFLDLMRTGFTEVARVSAS